ncbi:HNH endonuclease signature motif containing protein [Nitrobacter hamburgensis]|uniref:HNH endonuclease signature motif containing protein n=1 Tax=Nitrobacter hamburgensis TaxID=912 RepID=UPI0018DCE6EE|nr:HNH endonuclease signature motif containing protein [Nitrobacter hamburgensis]
MLVYEPTTGVLYKKHKLGRKHYSGYIICEIGGKHHAIHRLIWQLERGPIPEGFFVDHIDGNRSNNRLDNLRLVTMEGNAHNMAMTSRNKSGRIGVCWAPSQKTWFAYINVDKKLKILGRTKTKQEAINLREEAERKYGYHQNHGRRATPKDVALAA